MSVAGHNNIFQCKIHECIIETVSKYISHLIIIITRKLSNKKLRNISTLRVHSSHYKFWLINIAAIKSLRNMKEEINIKLRRIH